MDHNSQKFPKKICILTKTDIYMEENKVAIQINYKAFEMIQEFKNDPEKQLRLYNLIFKCSFLGEEINDEDMAVRMTAKSILLDIQECRNNYIEKCNHNENIDFSSIEKFCQSDKYRNKILTGTGKDRKEVMLAIERNFPDLKPSDAKVIRKIFRKMRKEQRNSIVADEKPKSIKKDIYALADEYAKERKEKATKEELKLWDCIKELGYPNIYFQQPVFISGKNGKPCKFYIADFLDVDNKIDIEVDGGYHTTEEQQLKDKEREEDFKKMGYSTLRITNEEVNSGKALGIIKDFYRKKSLYA